MKQLQINVTTSHVPREYQTEMKKLKPRCPENLRWCQIFLRVVPRKDLFYEKYIFDSCILHTNFRKKIL